MWGRVLELTQIMYGWLIAVLPLSLRRSIHWSQLNGIKEASSGWTRDSPKCDTSTDMNPRRHKTDSTGGSMEEVELKEEQRVRARDDQQSNAGEEE